MYIDFIPLDYYTPFWYHVIMAVTLITYVHTQSMALNSKEIKNYMPAMGGGLLVFALLYIGFRPVSGRYFADMARYDRNFHYYATGGVLEVDSDILFYSFMKLSSQIMTNHMFFFICAFAYIFPLYLVSKKWFKDYWFYAFLMLAGSFSFFSYGTNGLRNGIAGSFFLLGVSRDKRIFQILWLFLAINFHKAILLPVMGYILTHFYNKPQGYYILWLVCIPLSLGLSGFWENFFIGFMEGEERAYYLEGAGDDAEKFKSIGFRWDFLFYSSFGVVAGWYYIFKKKIKDKLYIQLYNTYLFANAFWILVIRANFSNRFAYLSWFMMAIIIVYPWTKYKFIQNQHKKFGVVLLAYVGFTYLMEFVYYQYIR